MKKKQLLAMVIAAVLFIIIGISSVGMNIIYALVSGNGNESASTGSTIFPVEDFVGVVEIVGTIQDLGEETLFSATTEYNHTTCVKYIEELSAAENNVGILLYIDSPGGYANIGDDLYLELLEYKEETGRPIYAYFDSLAASAAYYAAMTADEIYANRMTTTGSIGVYSTAYDMSELYNKLGIKEVIIKSGANKAMGSAGTPMTQEQIDILQDQVDYIYETFVGIVAEGRGLSRDTVYALADGRTYTAEQALEYNLIDGICRYEEYEEMVKAKFDDDVTIYHKSNTVSPFASLIGELKDITPKSDYQAITEFMEKKENGGYLYESIYH